MHCRQRFVRRTFVFNNIFLHEKILTHCLFACVQHGFILTGIWNTFTQGHEIFCDHWSCYWIDSIASCFTSCAKSFIIFVGKWWTSHALFVSNISSNRRHNYISDCRQLRPCVCDSNVCTNWYIDHVDRIGNINCVCLIFAEFHYCACNIFILLVSNIDMVQLRYQYYLCVTGRSKNCLLSQLNWCLATNRLAVIWILKALCVGKSLVPSAIVI